MIILIKIWTAVWLILGILKATKTV